MNSLSDSQKNYLVRVLGLSSIMLPVDLSQSGSKKNPDLCGEVLPELLVYLPHELSLPERELMEKIFTAVELKDWDIIDRVEKLKVWPEEASLFGIVFGERVWRKLQPEIPFAFALGKIQKIKEIHWLVTHSLAGMLPPLLERTILATKRQTWQHMKLLKEAMKNA